MSMVEIEKQMVALKQDASNHSLAIAKLMHEDFAIDVAAAWQRYVGFFILICRFRYHLLQIVR